MRDDDHAARIEKGLAGPNGNVIRAIAGFPTSDRALSMDPIDLPRAVPHG